MVRQHGFLGGGRTDQILPPGMPGFRDANVYSLRAANAATGEPARQRQHAQRQGDPVHVQRRRSARRSPRWCSSTCARSGSTSRSASTTASSSTRRWRRAASRSTSGTRAGARTTPIRPTSSTCCWTAAGSRPRTTSTRRTSTTRRYNRSWSRVAAVRRRPATRRTATSTPRSRATAAPMAPYINTNAKIFVVENVGCYTYSPIDASTNLVATCMK